MTKEAKIGIGIVHCQSTPGSTDIGFTPVYKSDNGKWSSLIDDTGAVFRHVKIGFETILRMIHFSKDGDGWYICSMKPIPGRDEEYRASWVYFPSSLDLTQKDIKDIIEVAESQIRHKEFDYNKLQEVIRSYTLCKEFSPRYIVPTVQQGFAFRDTSGDYNLYDLFGCMYQKEFTQYEWVILMDKALLTFKGNGIEDISNRKILESHIIMPESNEFGFTPYLNGAEFKYPVRIIDGEVLSIVFKKDGYLTINKDIKTQTDFAISAKECKKYFNKNQFIALDSKTNKIIESAKIKPFNVTEDKSGSYWFFEEQYLEKAKIDIKADGYNANSFELDLRNKTLEDNISMRLDPESHEYIFVLPLDNSVVKDHDTVEVKIQSQFAINESPVKGYKCSGTPREGGLPNRLKPIQHSYEVSSGNCVNRSNVNTSVSKTSSNESELALRQLSPGTRISVNKSTAKKQNKKNGYGKGLKRRQNANPKKFNWVIYAIAIVLLFIIVCIFVKKCNPSEKKEPEIILPRVEAQPKSDWGKAKDYLSRNNAYWTKSEMETYSELKGVYAMIKDFQFNELKSFIEEHPDLKDLDSWNRLYEITKKYNNKKGSFQADDNKIEIEKYLKTDFSSKEDVLSHSSGSNSSAASGSSSHELKGEVRKTTPANSSNRTGRSGSNNNTNSQDQLN